MENELIRHIGYEEIIDLISQTKDILLLSMPNIYAEISDSLIAYYPNFKKLKLIVDNSEDNFRNGYGDYKDVEKLRNANIEIHEIEGNMVSYIISDEKGYFLFPQSRIFSAQDNNSPNAVLMDAITLIKIKSYFFPPENEKEKEEYTNEVIELKTKIDESIKSSIEIIENKIEAKKFEPKKFDNVKFEEVKKKLEIIPPEQPDLKRQLSTYISKIQFVEMEFIGSHFNTLNIKIPPNALPYKDENLKKKLLTKMKLFENIEENKKYETYLKFINEFKEIKVEFLTPITCRKDKSILELNRKSEFLNKIKSVKEKISGVNKSLNELLKEEILNSRKVIKKVLQDFLKENPPENIKQYTGSLFDDSLDEEVNKIIYSIDFPEPVKILSKLDIEYRFYDLTIEDFKDQVLLNEFMKKGIMGINKKSIVEINNVFAMKK